MRVTDFQELSELEPNRKHHRARVRDRLWLKKASQVFPQELPRVKLQKELFLDSGKSEAPINYPTFNRNRWSLGYELSDFYVIPDSYKSGNYPG